MQERPVARPPAALQGGSRNGYDTDRDIETGGERQRSRGRAAQAEALARSADGDRTRDRQHGRLRDLTPAGVAGELRRRRVAPPAGAEADRFR